MILTDTEIREIWQSVEASSGLDNELLRRCGHLLRIGAFDEAVRNAFVLLEERLRKAINQEGMTGTSLANFAFKADGPLAKQLSHSASEREGLRELYSGAFKLFRNPTAHGVVGYDSVEGKSIIGLVNLLLKILARASELPPPNFFPVNLENVLADIERSAGASVAGRLRMFTGKCINIGVEAKASNKQWIAFQRQALKGNDDRKKQKPGMVIVFYIYSDEKTKGIWFPINQYYGGVVGLDTELFEKELRGLGFKQKGRYNDYSMDLQLHNSKEFFDRLFDVVSRIAKDFEESLSSRSDRPRFEPLI
jgi:uncharacterized protein (TIGR02391 family)